MAGILLEKLAFTRKICVDAINSCAHSLDMSIHSRIKERRLALGLNSHKALADLVGVSWQTVQLWEKEGGTAPNRNRINKVAEVLKVTPEWLTTGYEPANHIQPANTPASPTANFMKPLTQEEHRLAYEQLGSRNRSGMALHYVTPEEEQLLELFRLSFEEGREKILFAAETTKKRSLKGIAGDQPQRGKH